MCNINADTPAAKTLRQAISNKDAAAKFVEDPAAAFRAHGLDLEPAHMADFNNFAADDAGFSHIHYLANGSASGTDSDAESKVGCLACKAGVYPGALILVGMSYSALMALTDTSDVIIAIAKAFGINAKKIVHYVHDIAKKITGMGAGELAKQTCEHFGACS